MRPKKGDIVRLIQSPPDAMSAMGFGRLGDTGEVVMVDADNDVWLVCGKIWPLATIEIVTDVRKVTT